MASKSPPLINIIGISEYKKEISTKSNEPFIVLDDVSASKNLELSAITEKNIIGINEKGVFALLDGAVPPYRSWMKYVIEPMHQRDILQPQEYTKLFPEQSKLIATLQNILLEKHIEGKKVPAFASDLIGKYVEAMKLAELKTEDYQTKLDIEKQKNIETTPTISEFKYPEEQPQMPAEGAAGPAASGPAASGPAASAASGPAASGPAASGPGPAASGPAASAASGPGPAASAASGPAASAVVSATTASLKDTAAIDEVLESVMNSKKNSAVPTDSRVSIIDELLDDVMSEKEMIASVEKKLNKLIWGMKEIQTKHSNIKPLTNYQNFINTIMETEIKSAELLLNDWKNGKVTKDEAVQKITEHYKHVNAKISDTVYLMYLNNKKAVYDASQSITNLAGKVISINGIIKAFKNIHIGKLGQYVSEKGNIVIDFVVKNIRLKIEMRNISQLTLANYNIKYENIEKQIEDKFKDEADARMLLRKKLEIKLVEIAESFFTINNLRKVENKINDYIYSIVQLFWDLRSSGYYIYPCEQIWENASFKCTDDNQVNIDSTILKNFINLFSGNHKELLEKLIKPSAGKVRYIDVTSEKNAKLVEYDVDISGKVLLDGKEIPEESAKLIRVYPGFERPGTKEEEEERRRQEEAERRRQQEAEERRKEEAERRSREEAERRRQEEAERRRQQEAEERRKEEEAKEKRFRNYMTSFLNTKMDHAGSEIRIQMLNNEAEYANALEVLNKYTSESSPAWKLLGFENKDIYDRAINTKKSFFLKFHPDKYTSSDIKEKVGKFFVLINPILNPSGGKYTRRHRKSKQFTRKMPM